MARERDWYAIDADLDTHPRFLAFCRAGCLTPADALFALHIVWSLAIRKYLDGILTGHDLASLDAIIVNRGGKAGCAKAMSESGFLTVRLHEVDVRNWMEWNGRKLNDRIRKRGRLNGDENGGSAEVPRKSVEIPGNSTPTVTVTRTGTEALESKAAPSLPSVATERGATRAKVGPPTAEAPLGAQPVIPPKPSPVTSRYHGSQVAEQIHAVALRVQCGDNCERTAMALAARIKSHSPWIDDRDLVGMVDYWLCRRSQIENPFAYFAKGSEGFTFAERSVRLEREQAEHDSHKRDRMESVGSILGRVITAAATNGVKP